MTPNPKNGLGAVSKRIRCRFWEGIRFYLVFSIDGVMGAEGKKRGKSIKYSQKVTNIGNK